MLLKEQIVKSPSSPLPKPSEGFWFKEQTQAMPLNYSKILLHRQQQVKTKLFIFP
jgi:hypothetical protein